MNLRNSVFIVALLMSITIPGRPGADTVSLNGQLSVPIAFTELKEPGGGAGYVARTPGGSVSVTAGGLSLVLNAGESAGSPAAKPAGRERHTLRLRFVGARENPTLSGEDRLSWNTNYFLGNDPARWKTDAPTYAGVRYHEVYPGIDAVFSGGENRLKSDFIVRPGADPSRITLACEGATGIGVTPEGDLLVESPAGTMRERKPYCYQVIGGKKVEVPGRYVIRDAATCSYGFETGPYDPAHDLVIDPELVFSTLYGGGRGDFCTSIAVDREGNVYLAGVTVSPDLPFSSGAYDSTGSSPGSEAFIVKFDPTGSGIRYATYLGGRSNENEAVLEIDDEGNVCIAGSTQSAEFPRTPGAYAEIGPSPYRLFITKLNEAGNALIFSAVFGNPDDIIGMRMDEAGNVYVAGTGYVPITPGAIQDAAYGDLRTPFILKLSADGKSLRYATWFGGEEVGGTPKITGMDVDHAGNAYLIGKTHDPEFPITANALDSRFELSTTDSLRWNGFLSKLSPDGELLYSSFLFHLYPHTVCVDSFGAVCLSGTPYPYGRFSVFPITEGAYNTDIWYPDLLCKISPSGRDLVFSTYLFHGRVNDIEVDAGGNILMGGYAPDSQFFPASLPVTPDAYDRSYNGGMADAFLGKMNPSGSEMLYLTYLGGSDTDESRDLAIDRFGNAYLTGTTDSRDFPTTEGAWDRTFNGEIDSWACKFSFDSGPVAVEESPRVFNLNPARPNPFNPSTTISFTLPAPGRAELVIYSVTGQKVRTLLSGHSTAGAHEVTWDGRDDGGAPVSSGVYLSRLESGGIVATGKMLLVK